MDGVYDRVDTPNKARADDRFNRNWRKRLMDIAERTGDWPSHEEAMEMRRKMLDDYEYWSR